MKFSLGSELIYTAERDTTLILNVEAQHLRGQRVLSERFSIGPELRTESHEIPETLNRYRRLMLKPGRYTIRYEAEVETDPDAAASGQGGGSGRG
jgi:hypothetical protein